MGYGTRPNRLGGDIRTYWPDDDDNTIYIESGTCPTLADIQARIDEKWPGASAANIEFGSEEINTDCLGYDMYDPSDWTNFIIITRKHGA